jgi:hypothetical protein
MSKSMKQLKAWLPPIAGICAVFISAGYAWSIKTSTAKEIGQLHELGTTLDSAAQDVNSTMLSPEEVRKLEHIEADLRHRMADVRQPGLVQAELMASARDSQLDVREIQPIAPTGKIAGAAAPACPHYRVSVAGGYQQIAEYMQKCKSQRLPVRVIGFRLGRPNDEKGRPTEKITADITVEVFQPPQPAKQGT